MLYSRIELTFSDAGDEYLALFPKFVSDKLLGGIRYDITHYSALKFEISANRTRREDFFEIGFQWSFMF